MLVSVIIPTFNRARTIEQAVNSVLAQTWRDIETIVVDDGSADNTLDVLAKYGDKIRVIAQNNQGPSAARNTGIKAARGEILSFLDSDDSWLPTKVEQQTKLFEQTSSEGVGCCVSNIRMVYADGAETTSFALADLRPKHQQGIWLNPTDILLTRFLLFNQAAAVRREMLAAAGYFRQDLRILEDYDLALRLSMIGPWAYTSNPLVIWNGGSENSLTSAATELLAARKNHEILDGLAGSAQWGRQLPRKLLQQRLGYLQWRIRGLQHAGSKTRFGRWYGRCLLLGLKNYKAVHDRMPFFPRMLTKEV